MHPNEKHSDKTVLAHWIYTKDEWKAFIKWKKIRKSIFHFFIHWITPKSKRQVPEIMITSDNIWIGNKHHSFNNAGSRLKRINIFDAGSINVMEISYDSKTQSSLINNEIKFPVPKGKLREAISIQEKLSNAGQLV